MVNFFKKILLLFLIGFSLVACNSTNTKNPLPEVKPKDFNFVFNYGVNAKNQLNTIRGQYTKDMIIEPSITTDFKLSDEEMNIIYLAMREINIMNYPENFIPKSNHFQTPFNTYSIKIVMEGKEKNIYWKDENVSETKEAERLRELFKKIQEVIINKDEYKRLPEAQGGYD